MAAVQAPVERCVLVLLAALVAASAGAQPSPRRIVSLIPATTEMLFAMGAGDRVVGVSNYDRFPPEAERLPRMGGLLDPALEPLLALKPDLVIVYDTQTDLKAQLQRAGIAMFRYEHRTLADITQTMRALGARVGAAAAANAAADQIERRLVSIRASTTGGKRPSTLLVFGREPGTLRGIDASGGFGFLHDLLEVAGGTNVLADIRRQAVSVSTEMVLARAPEVIIELRYGDSATKQRADADLQVWRALPSVPAVRDNRIYQLTGNEFVIPGPRIVDAAERLAATLRR